MVSKYLDEFLYAPFMAGDYDESVLALYEGIHDRYVSSFGMGDGDAYMGYEDPNVYYVETGFGTFFFFLILVLVLLIVADGRRYRRYRSGYYGPTYVYRPIFFGRPWIHHHPPHHHHHGYASRCSGHHRQDHHHELYSGAKR